jgi:hypothetical protein
MRPLNETRKEGGRRHCSFAIPSSLTVQSVSVKQCGGLILLSCDCCVNMPPVRSKLGSKTLHSQSREIVTDVCNFMKREAEVKIK